jgi:hypothetical protein
MVAGLEVTVRCLVFDCQGEGGAVGLLQARQASPGMLPRRAWSAGCWSEEREGGGRRSGGGPVWRRARGRGLEAEGRRRGRKKKGEKKKEKREKKKEKR